MFSLIGLVMVFSRGKGLGKAAEVAGAGVQLIPGAEMVGAGMMAAGRHMQQKAGATKAASSASNAVVRQRAAAKQAPRQRASAPAPSNEDQMAAAHAQGVLTGRTQGRQRSTLSPSVATSGSGARYSELGGGEF
jgi:Flp pilus assembly protein TadG